ncbi:helix-turn-helix transcriptional regulator [Caenibius tardaugens]|uniref:helix-turn-helix transcriptional regulator n=1 Tax=Caenibius tardaugens TaxID=169176 RepID=UPI0013757788|nr:helix-turn-helix transcriptional regulator [Caenibius tardaugens]
MDSLIGTIYEAGALPQFWGSMLDGVALQINALGGNLITSSPAGLTITSSPSVELATREFNEAGWNADNSRVNRLLARANHPGFLTDADLHTAQELASLPIYTEFLTPRGAAAGAATVITGANHDGIVIAFEAFTEHATAHKAVPLLNRLRPHFARAAVLSSTVQQERAETLLEAFNATRTPVGLLDAKGKLLMASDAFDPLLDDLVVDGAFRLRLMDVEADNHLAELLQTATLTNKGASIALRNDKKQGAAVLHLIPARRQARDLFSKVAYFTVIAHPDNTSLPSADVLSALFDLTPTEARVTRGIAMGQSTAELVRELNVTQETIKSHLKKIFAKTATHRQGDLALLITGFR